MLAAWRTSHLEAVSSAKGSLVAAELAKLPTETLAAQSYREQCLTPLKSVLCGSLVELFMVQKEQMQVSSRQDLPLISEQRTAKFSVSPDCSLSQVCL
eukprot:COSAG02_NODE_5570_length_4223_cov_2.546314_4_plen_98_part_00